MNLGRRSFRSRYGQPCPTPPQPPLLAAAGGMVENSAAQLGELERVLTAHGYRCVTCRGSGEALETARIHQFDGVVCGAELDGISGVSLYSQILSECDSFVPAVFLSSTQTADIIRRPLGNRGTYFLRRPWSGEVLVALLERLRAVDTASPNQSSGR